MPKKNIVKFWAPWYENLYLKEEHSIKMRVKVVMRVAKRFEQKTLACNSFFDESAKLCLICTKDILLHFTFTSTNRRIV